MRRTQLGVSVLLLVLLLMACVPKAGPTPQPPMAPAPAPAVAPAPALAAVPAAPVKAAWEGRWEETVAAAKKEGSVVLYASIGPQFRRIIAPSFESNYGVRVEIVTGGSAAIIPKISAERRAGIYSGDVVQSGSSAGGRFKGFCDTLDSVLILPELTEPELVKKTWYFGELPWGNKSHTWLISLIEFKDPIFLNTNLVKPSEITAYRDLLDPKWKGKISLQDPLAFGLGFTWFAATLEVGDLDVNYMRELLTKQELFVTRDWRLQVEWLARGKHAIAIGAEQATVTEFIGLGAPLTRLNLGTRYVSGGPSGIGILQRPPHPNAARLFINWLLGQEGQLLHSQAVGAQSQRLDVPATHLEPSRVLEPGLKLFRADEEEYVAKKDTYYTKLAQEIFGSPTK